MDGAKSHGVHDNVVMAYERRSVERGRMDRDGGGEHVVETEEEEA